MEARVREVLEALRAHASPTILAEMAPRYGLVVDKAMGVAMNRMQAVAKPLKPDHALAQALWDTGWYEARMVACMIDDPAAVTPEQMDGLFKPFNRLGRERSALQGTGIGLVISRRLAELIPGSELVLVPDAGHLVQLDAPAALTAVLQRWLLARRDEEA